jgi:DNA-binding PadR family transcriptional regulator
MPPQPLRRGCPREAGGQPRRIRRFIEPALLLLLHCTPTHGYALVEGLKGLGLDRYPVDMSAIYRILYDLEASGILSSSQDSESTAGPPRRVYALTEAGDGYLRAWVQDLRETDEILHCFLEAYDAHQLGHDIENQVARRDAPSATPARA